MTSMSRPASWTVLVLLSAAPALVWADEAGESERAERAWFGLPVLFQLPETSTGFGAVGGLHLITPGRPTSSVQAAVIYTLERQFSTETALQVFDTERTAISASAIAARFPYRFYGTGPAAARSAEERYTSYYAEVMVAREWVVSPGLRLGPKLHGRVEDLRELEPGGQLASGRAASADYAAIGLGATVTFDDRDDPFWPTRGTFVESWVLGYGTGEAHAFGRASVEGRRFSPLGHGHILGVDVRLESAAGTVPFTLLPKLGGPRGLRGYYEGRWRDRILWSTQAEWRFPVAWRLKGTVFGGVAGVAPSLARLDETRPRPAGGVGIRFRLTPTGLNVRGDLALGQEGLATYLTIGEAF